MFDFGFTEMMLIGVVALVVIGPERLPSVARTAGKYFGKMKRFVTSVKSDVESELRADELREILNKQQEELNSLKDVVKEAGKDLDMSSIVDKPTTSSSESREATPATDDSPEQISPTPKKAVKARKKTVKTAKKKSTAPKKKAGASKT
jgi:sec-independent protein translocase protein TatB